MVVLRPESPIPLSARVGDPIVETIARSVFALFPRCRKCGVRIERFDEADVRILQHRIVHRTECQPTEEPPG